MKNQLLKFESSQIFKPEKRELNHLISKVGKLEQIIKLRKKWGAELRFVLEIK